MKKTILSVFCLMLVMITVSGLRGELPIVSRSLLNYFDNLDTGEISRDDLQNDRYYRMVDEKGKEIMVTGRKIHVGDEYITSANRLYRVFRVQEQVAYARYIKQVGAFFAEEHSIRTVVQKFFMRGVQPVQNNEKEEEEPQEDLEPQPEPKRLIGVYHTHNAESYVPSDGTDSINGVGGIHNVGEAFTNSLEEKGITVFHDNTLHLPHDRGAYRRSRVTVEGLIEKGPDVIFDIHRDAGPARAYAAQIDGEWVTQVQLVVGRQNPKMQTIRQFALDLKNTADEIHPKLVKGIFMARGNYNQDLTATSMLIEVGTHLNNKVAAQDGVALFADVISFYFYGDVNPQEGEEAAPAPARNGPASRGPQGRTPAGVNRTAARNAFWMLAVTALIAFAFLLINTPLATIRSKLEPWVKKTIPYTAKGDAFLDALHEKFRNAALFAAAKTVVFIERGDAFLDPVSLRIKEIYELVKAKTVAVLDSGDQVLGFWRERIRDTALSVKEKGRQLRDRNKLK